MTITPSAKAYIKKFTLKDQDPQKEMSPPLLSFWNGLVKLEVAYPIAMAGIYDLPLFIHVTLGLEKIPYLLISADNSEEFFRGSTLKTDEHGELIVVHQIEE